MKLLVQKFGGTSTVSRESRAHCVEHIKRAVDQGYAVVVVVSAMGRLGSPYATDSLLSLLENEPLLAKSELDLFLSAGETISAGVFSNALLNSGIRNTILTGGQAGIITDNQYNNASILSLNPLLLKEKLTQYPVVLVPGFQGITEDGFLTTLGRGGSDTTASAIGTALEAEFIDIFTDVNGVYTADPNIVKEAQPLLSMTYNESCNLANMGAKVIHPRAVEMAMKGNVPIRIRSTFSNETGTMITSYTKDQSYRENLITGITQTKGIKQFTVLREFDDTLFPLRVFKCLKEQKINVDFINITPDHTTFTIQKNDESLSRHLLENSEGYKVQIREESLAKVAIVGANMSGVPGVMSRIVESLTKSSIEIYQSADSHSTIWVLIPELKMNQAVRILHNEFILSKNRLQS
ncbi:aspartate kinase (plasmid) [Pontibacillus sp. ALD_SL1]|uniref:aspartate kinase n=1 Tax=Pontibacillus sp. ALD_SL1 TaxID=2777185 RepID=UPI001A966510|nr:aspartate kinase [Pontibacillus sp. ALD_SL1]QST02045.1 aspartate kinase [Pontibacillus sp. ALD_SL1]